MILIPEIRAPFDNIRSRVAHSGRMIGTGVGVSALCPDAPHHHC